MKKLIAACQALVIAAVIFTLAWGEPVLIPATSLVGQVPVAKGGTGSDNAAGARTNLGLEAWEQDNVAITGGTIDNTPIGVTTPEVGHFTTLDATGAADFMGNASKCTRIR